MDDTGVGMTGVRGVLRTLGGAALTLGLSVTANQVLSEGKLSWTWSYVSYAVAVVSLLYAELGPSPPTTDPSPRGRRRIYLRQLRASVRDMETVGIATQSEFVFRMRQVYVDVSVVPKVLHDAAREPYLGSVSGEERRSLESVLRKAGRNGGSRILAVLGGPGSGKTTLARNTALELCGHRWRPWKRRLPVLLYLRRHAADLLAGDPPTLAESAVRAAWLDGKVSARWLDHRLDRGGCVVLLDGLDEVADPAERGRVVDWVGRQIQRYPRNIYVVTSRPHGYKSNPLPGAEVLQVRRFTWEQIDRFLRRWSYATESRARGGGGREVRAAADRNAANLLTRLQTQGALYDLAANPLLLTMTANVHRYRGQLPASRAELYDEMCDVLLHRRSEARGLVDATGLTGPHKQHVAQHLALAMMKAEVKDWPVRDAARAIRRSLRQVPGSVTPKVFLEVACASGLLVEREHEVYGFAHLTLQEYLAAAQLGNPRADTSVLIDHVEDPWWREAILLWCAANDATDIITACLDRATVPALALAFDCADQARTVEPETRDRLEELLGPPAPNAPHDPARQHLLDGIHGTRILRETVRLQDNTTLCAQPVPLSLYLSFVHEEKAAGLHHPDPFDRLGHDVDAAVGMRVGDVERFVEWLNTVTGDAVYRLPTLAEVKDPAAASITGLGRHTVWAHDGAHTVLHQPGDAPWPYATDTEHLPGIPAADRLQLNPYLRLLTTPATQRSQVEPWTRVLSAALAHAPESHGTPEFAPLELPLVLALSVGLHIARVHARAFDSDADVVSRASLERLIVRALGFARHLDVARATGLARDLDAGLATMLGEALGTVGDLRDWMTQTLDPNRDTRAGLTDSDTSLLLARSILIELTLGNAVDLARHLDLGPALGLARDLDPPLHPDGLDLVFGTAPLPPDLAGDLAHRLDSLYTLTAEREQDTDPGFVSSLDLALDLSHDLTASVHTEALMLSLDAFRLLFTHSTAVIASPSALSRLDHVLTRTAAAIPAHQRTLSDPATAVRHAHDILRTTQAPVPDHPITEVRHLTDSIGQLLTSMRSRNTPTDSRTLSSARTALLIAITVLTEADLRDRAAIRLLELAWLSLTTFDTPASRRPHPNQLLVLARTQP